MTSTAAYNANEVAAVYMSFNRTDLLSSDEGGGGHLNDISLRNGFFGLSDPMNLRGTLQRFECDFTRGSNSSHYRIRIINPTDELETYLIGFYEEVFPEKLSVFKEFKTEGERQRRYRDVEAVTGDTDASLIQTETNALPRLYLRFGYGTDSAQGLSRIHKLILNDIKYIVSENADKVVELQLTDTFTYSQLNRSFNRRPYVAQVPILDEKDTLKNPSQILQEVIVNYMEAYPECIPVVDFGEYATKIDNLTFSLAFALAEGDKTSELLESAQPITTEALILSQEQREQLDTLLDRPITSKVAIDRGARGVVTQSILLQAYRLTFEQIGLKFKSGEYEVPPGLDPNQLSANQLNNLLIAVDFPQNESAKLQISEAESKAVADEKVNILTELLRKDFAKSFTQSYTNQAPRPNFEGKFTPRLGYYPKILDYAPRDEEAVGRLKLGNITNISYGPLNIPDWNGIPATGDFADGTGTGPVKPTPTISQQKGFIIQFDVDPREQMNPLGLAFYDNPYERLGSNGNPLSPGYDPNGRDGLNGPNWYDKRLYLGNLGGASYQGSIPPFTKVVFKDVQFSGGSINFNDIPFYVIYPDLTDFNTNGFKVFVVDELGLGQEYIDAIDNNEWPGPEGGDLPSWLGSDAYGSLGNFVQGTGASVYLYDDELDDLLSGPKTIRDITFEEKTSSSVPTLFLEPGLVNTKGNNIFDSYTPLNAEDVGNYTTFTYGDLDALIDARDVVMARQAREQGRNYIYPSLPVNMPLQSPYGNTFRTPGPQGEPYLGWKKQVPYYSSPDSAVGANGELLDFFGDIYQGPIWDKTINDWLPLSGAAEIPDGESDLKSWYRAAWSLWITGLNLTREQIGIEDFIVKALLESRYMPLLHLEPTIDTVSWLNLILANEREVAQAEQLRQIEDPDREELENADTIVEAPPPVSKVPEVPLANAFVFFGAEGTQPHITGALQTLINGINKLVIGENSKMELIPIDISRLSPEDKKTLSEHASAFFAEKWEDKWATSNYTLLLLGPTGSIASQYSDRIIRPILSFPQTRFGEEKDPKVLYLNYGQSDSLVVRLEFQGDTRVLTNMAGASYAVRQWHDIKSVFSSKELNNQIIYNILGLGVSEKLQKLKEQFSAPDDYTALVTSEEYKKLINTQIQINEDPDKGSSDCVVDLELLQLLPELVSYIPDGDIAEKYGAKVEDEIRVLMSVVQSVDFLNLIWPDATIDGSTGKKKNQKIIVTTEPGQPPRVSKVESDTRILPRKVDFAYIYSRIGILETAQKMNDFRFSYYNAMAQDSFEIKLTTLGIPEIDDIASEVLSRIVVFDFQDIRFATGQQHWLSGVYRINGFKHKLDPQAGFLTELSLFRDPEYNITKVTR